MSGPTSRIERMFFGLIALGCTVAALVLLWRACAVCRAWWAGS